MGAQALVGQQALHQTLAVVEVAPHRQVQDVGRIDRRHLTALNRGDPFVRVEDDQADAVGVGEGGDGGGAGVAAGRGDQGQLLARGCERLRRQGGGQLHGQVLEGGGGAVEQLQHIEAVFELAQRRDLGRGEACDQTVQRAVQTARGEGVADEGRHRLSGHLGIGATRGPGVGRERRPGGGHVEAAVGRHAAQKGLGEVGHGGVATGRDVSVGGGGHDHSG